MNADEIRAAMRSKLRTVGLTPTERGEELTRRNQTQMRQQAHDAIERMEPADLFSVWLIADELTRTDEPPAKPLKKG